MPQLVLPIFPRPDPTFDNLVIHEGNREATGVVGTVYGGAHESYPNLYLYGPSGSGKTHLLRASANALGLVHPLGFFLDAASEDFSLEIAEHLLTTSGESDSADRVSPAWFIIDDIHLAPESSEQMIWTLANQLTRRGAPLLVSSETAPEQVFRANDHVRTRLTSGLVLALQSPEDHIRVLILDRLAAERKIPISRDVHHYLITRKSRNVKELAEIMDALDAASLEEKRRITVPFIKQLEKDGRL